MYAELNFDWKLNEYILKPKSYSNQSWKSNISKPNVELLKLFSASTNNSQLTYFSFMPSKVKLSKQSECFSNQISSTLLESAWTADVNFELLGFKNVDYTILIQLLFAELTQGTRCASQSWGTNWTPIQPEKEKKIVVCWLSFYQHYQAKYSIYI